MKKKIIIGLLAFVVIIIVGLYFANNRNRTMSPPGKAELTVGELTVNVPYSRPSVRGRAIFGVEAEKFLLPYGKYWRLGANETTQISFSKNVTFNGEPVDAGNYRIYAIPGPDAFEIRLNSEMGFMGWGAWEPDYTKDFLKTNVSVQKTESNVESFTITLVEADGGMNMNIEWADTRLVIPIKAQ